MSLLSNVHQSYAYLLLFVIFHKNYMVASSNSSALPALCAGTSPLTSEYPSQRPVMWSFYVSFDLRWINGWLNNWDAGDLSRHRAHYDVIIMYDSNQI